MEELYENKTTQRRTYQNRILLEEFWSKAKARSQKTRMALLRDFACRVLVPDPFIGHDTGWMRRHYQKRRSSGFVRSIRECWVCSYDAEDRHHIIPIKNGGRNIVTNIVALCKDCHRDVHRRS
jgi:5-methylcytosine-specific restriction endonuclease McrA